MPSAKAEDENHGVLAGGVVHNIASDRKIEKIGGILQPEPLDIYLKRLFEEFSKKMDRMDERLQNIERAVRQEGRMPAAASLTHPAEAAQRK